MAQIMALFKSSITPVGGAASTSDHIPSGTRSIYQCSFSSAIYDRRSRHLVSVSNFSFIFAPKRTEATKKCTRNHLIESLTGSHTHTRNLLTIFSRLVSFFF
uniref:(northern house mosquito) hypothetical protein n=1 Tax=Culex pipiens TaxID=7175 RepID=A0A8D8CP89_CULPI